MRPSAGLQRWDRRKTLGTSASPGRVSSFSRRDNLALLHLIGTQHPDSMREAGETLSSQESNLSRTLKKLHEAGIVEFEEGAGRTRCAALIARRVTPDLDLVGPGSVVSVERPEVAKGQLMKPILTRFKAALQG